MITLKETAEFIGMSSGAVIGFLVTNEIFNYINKELYITSGTDWLHSENSDHYKGDAFDIRTRHLSNSEVNKVLELLKEKLNSDYFILKHSSHIHVSFRPSGKKREKIAVEMLKSKGYKVEKNAN
jgi:hypothetical protein